MHLYQGHQANHPQQWKELKKVKIENTRQQLHRPPNSAVGAAFRLEVWVQQPPCLALGRDHDLWSQYLSLHQRQEPLERSWRCLSRSQSELVAYTKLGKNPVHWP